MLRTVHRSRLLVLLLLVSLALGAASCGDDDDDASGSEATATTATTAEGEGNVEEEEPSEPLTPEEARAAGNPATFERIAAMTDCAEVTAERDRQKTNAERRADDPERQSILLAYVEAAETRMTELNCGGV